MAANYSSNKSKRHRGYFFTPAGSTKLKNRIRELEAKTGVKYNPPKIAEQSQLISAQGLHPTTIRKILRGSSGGDESSLRLIFQVVGLELEAQDYTLPGIEEFVTVTSFQDWGEAVDTSVFYGRESELLELKQWIQSERCRLVTLLGMGGIGKTTLSVKLAQQLQDHFEFTIWRSLRNAPPLEELLPQLLQFLSQQQATDGSLPKTTGNCISRLMEYLRQQRCLLVLDNVETLLKQGSPAGRYREGYEEYGELFRRIAETAHQSCLVLTSREKPQGITALEGESLPVRSWQVSGLAIEEGAKILSAKGLNCSEAQIQQLTQLYQGNPLALKIVATSIQSLFAGNVAEFLAQGVAVFNGIRNLLAEQFDRLSSLEQQILYWLAIHREPVTLNQLREDIIPLISPSRLLEALEYIDWRSLIETGTAYRHKTWQSYWEQEEQSNFPTTQLGSSPLTQTQFTLQPVVMEYVCDRLIEEVCEEIYKTSQSQENLAHLNLFKSLALIKADSQDYIRASQIHLILKPIAQKLLTIFGSQETLVTVLREILSRLRSHRPATASYMAGNLVNLLVHLKANLSDYDFSQLTICQADFQGIHLHRANFTQANLAKSVFSETFAPIYSLALSPDGILVATGHADGEVRLWDIAEGKLLFRTKIHTSTVWSVAFSPDGKILASGSFDCSIRLWDIHKQQLYQTLQGHQDWVWSVAFHPQGKMLASGSSDRTIRLWDLKTGNCIKTLQQHADIVNAVAFSPDGNYLASAGVDQTIKLWEVQTGRCCKTFQGHRHQISSVSFSPDGFMLASCEMQAIKLWDIKTGECLQTVEETLTFVWSIAFSADGETLIIGDKGIIKLWDIEIERCYQIFLGYNSQVWSVASIATQSKSSQLERKLIAGVDKQNLKVWQVEPDKNYLLLQTIQSYKNSILSVIFSPDGNIFASGGTDRIVSFWDISTRSCQFTISQHQKSIRTLAFSRDGKLLASGSEDKTIALWERETGKIRLPLVGHTDCVWSVAFSPDSQTLASGSSDQTIRLWSIKSGRILKILTGHESWVLSVAFSPNGQLIASSSADQTIRLWDVNTGQCLRILLGHQGLIWSVTFSQDGQTLASASEDETVKLWHIETGECYQTLQGHQSLVWSVAFSPNHPILASSSVDQTIRLWDIHQGQCIKVLEGHKSSVWSVAFSPNGTTLVSGSNDETIRLWNVETGECLDILRPERIYEGMNITGAIGLTEAQKATLKALGAVED